MRRTSLIVLLVLAPLARLPRAAGAASAFSLDHAGVEHDVYRLGRGEEQRLRLFWRRADGTPYGTLQALVQERRERGRPLAFATNGGIFSREHTPLGLYIEDGRRYYRLNQGRGGGNFFLLPNGVLYVTEDGARVVRTEDYRPERPVRQAVQSGPILVSHGRLHPRFIVDSPSRYVRNGVGVDAQGRVVFAISDAPVSFHDFGTLFRDRLDCPDALYLDGSVSAMYAPQLGRLGGWPWQRLTTMIGVEAGERRVGLED